jgi:hypothetical protein
MPMTFHSPTPIAIQIPFYAVVYFDDSRRKDKGRMSYALIRPFVHKRNAAGNQRRLLSKQSFITAGVPAVNRNEPPTTIRKGKE